MEGVAGIVKWQQTNGGEALYEEGRMLYTRGDQRRRARREGGRRDRDRRDGLPRRRQGLHFNSLLPELLDPDCEYVVQEEWTEYTAFLEQRLRRGAVRRHARDGRDAGDGVLNHTVSGQAWQNLWFNGTLVGETGINAALCGTWGCPVLLVTGDRAVCREATRAARRRAHDGRGEAGTRPLQRARLCRRCGRAS